MMCDIEFESVLDKFYSLELMGTPLTLLKRI